MKIFVYIAAVLMFALYAACTAPIELQTRNSKPVIVIYGFLTDELNNQRIRLTSSAPYFDKKPDKEVPEANVTITSSDGETYTFTRAEDGYYISEIKFAVSVGIAYRLRVEVDFDSDGVQEIYEAETTPQPIVPADSVVVATEYIMGFRCFAIKLFMQEPEDTENYYQFKYIVNDSVTNDRLTETLISNDHLFNGAYMNGVTLLYMADATADNSIFGNNERNEDQIQLRPGDRIRLLVLNIEKGYYHFINECRAERNGENPIFGGPPSNITTNLSNGAVGYFTSFCIQELYTETPSPSTLPFER